MKISKKRLDEIEFERIHRIPTRVREELINEHPRPITAKVPFFKDKQQIKSHIKQLPRGKGFDGCYKKRALPGAEKGKEGSQNSFLQRRKANY